MLSKLSASLLLITAEFLPTGFEMMSGKRVLDKHQNTTVGHFRGANLKEISVPMNF